MHRDKRELLGGVSFDNRLPRHIIGEVRNRIKQGFDFIGLKYYYKNIVDISIVGNKIIVTQ